MARTRDTIEALPLGEIRRLLSLRDKMDEISALMEKRDELLSQLGLIDKQLEEMCSDTGSSPRRVKRQGPSVRNLCEEMLRRKPTGLTPAEVKDAILEKYPHRNNKTFYNQVFIALSRNDNFRKMANGTFRLKKAR